VDPGHTTVWQPLDVSELDASDPGHHFDAILHGPAGGWYRLEVRASTNGQVMAQAAVQHVGIGELLVVAGQSNAANHGEEKQVTRTRRVAAFDGRQWRLADDPQPGASGQGGSFMPPLGDELAQRLDVPVGFIACGIGSCTFVARRSESPPGKAAEAVPSRAVCGHTVRRGTRGQHSQAGLQPVAAGRA
jgi:hypothetical protein